MSCQSPIPTGYAHGGDGHFHSMNGHTHINDPFGLEQARPYATWQDKIEWNFDFNLFLDPQLPGGDALDTGKPRQQLSPSVSELSTITEDEGKFIPEQTPHDFGPCDVPVQEHFHNSHLYPAQCHGCASCREMAIIPLPIPSSLSLSLVSPAAHPDSTARPESQSQGKKRKATTATRSSSSSPTDTRKTNVAATSDAAASRPSRRPRAQSHHTKQISPVPSANKPSHSSSPPLAQRKLPERAHSAIEKRYRASLNNKFEALRSCVVGARPWLADSSGDGEAPENGTGGCDKKEAPKMNKTRVLSEAVIYIKQLEDHARNWQEQSEALKRRILSGKMALEGEERGVS